MVRWNSSPHPISDVREWYQNGRLEVKPDFQRRPVWSASAKIMLMDTILKGIPMPKIFLSKQIKDEKTYRIVIDGQQRIRAILDFLGDKFPLATPYSGEQLGKRFSDLDQAVKDSFLDYPIDFNEALNPSDEEIRDVYSRVNKYTVVLNKQELRKADFPGAFSELAEQLSAAPFMVHSNIFTPATLRRSGDVEFVSELLMALIEGIKTKKGDLDNIYFKYTTWEPRHKEAITARFKSAIKQLEKIFDRGFPISNTRFRQKSDFYSIFVVIDELLEEGHTLNTNCLKPLQQDLKILSNNIRPESNIEAFMEYAVKCVSQANSASSRRWRHKFLKTVVSPAYSEMARDATSSLILYRILEDLHTKDALSKNFSKTPSCSICNKYVDVKNIDSKIAWISTQECKQLSNASWIHSTCMNQGVSYSVLERPNKNEQLDFL